MTIKERLRCLVGPLICVVAGLALATTPHLRAWSLTGDPTWIADHDEVFYLQVGSQAYFNHPTRLADPVRAEGGLGIYKPLPLVPGVAAARALGLGPFAVGTAWRVWAGVTIGLAWYVLCRRWFKDGRIAVALAVAMMADGGALEGRPLVRQISNVAKIVRGDDSLFSTKPRLMPQWRISTPGATMAFLLLSIWATLRARERPSAGRVALSGLAYGLLYHVYFYYWTAATLALGISFLFDRPGRRAYFGTGLLGILVGAPSLVADVIAKRTTAPDWLLRSDKFLPIGRFSELLIPWGAAAILIVAGVFVWTRRRDLVYAWSLGLAGLALANHQIVTGLQIENFHWIYVWGPTISLVPCVLVLGRLERRFAGGLGLPAGVSAIALAMLASGLWARGLEAGRSADSVRLDAERVAFLKWSARTGWGEAEHEPNATLAGPRELVDFAVVQGNFRPLDGYATTLSSSVTNAEWDERRALNALLLGLDRGRFEADQRRGLEAEPWGPWGKGRDPKARSERLASRLEAYNRLASTIDERLDLWNVRYRLSAPPPPPPETAWRNAGGWFERRRGGLSPLRESSPRPKP